MASAVYLPGTAGSTIADETVALVREAMGDATRAITMASGLMGYELEAPAKVIVPVVTPLANMLPRRRGTAQISSIGRRSPASTPRATGACWRMAARRAR